MTTRQTDGENDSATSIVNRLDAAVSCVGLADVQCSGRDTPRDREETVTAYELALVRRGVLARHCRGRSSLLVQGALAVFQPAQPYRITHPVCGGDACTVISVPRDLLDSVSPGLVQFLNRPSARTSVMLRPEVSLRVRLASRSARTGDLLCAEEEVVRLLPDLLADLGERASRPDMQRSATRRAQELAAYVVAEIGRRYAEPLTLRALSRSVNVSPFHLSRIVHATCGVPVHQLLLRHRLTAAAERVLDGTTSLSRLALDLGFSSHSHFTASFHSVFHMTPTRLRRLAARNCRSAREGLGTLRVSCTATALR